MINKSYPYHFRNKCSGLIIKKPANGVVSLQMVGDVRLCFYNHKRPVSVTKAPFKDLLLFTDHSIQSQCGKLRPTFYPNKSRECATSGDKHVSCP